MPHITVPTAKNQEITLNYVDYGRGHPIVLIHGWSLTHRAWEPQMAALVEAGYRVIAYDRRGFGDSEKPWDGYDYDTLAADLKGLIDTLGLVDFFLAGFSMGGGEVARYLGKYGSKNLAGAMLISAVTPYMKKTNDNPHGVDASIFQGMKDGVAKDRFSFIADWRDHFMNYKDNKKDLSKEFMEFLWLQTTYAAPQAMRDCITAFGETDFRGDLKKFDVPTLVIHGDADNICPLEVCGERAAEHLDNVYLKVVKGGPHGLNVTHKDEVNDLMIGFMEQAMRKAA